MPGYNKPPARRFGSAFRKMQYYRRRLNVVPSVAPSAHNNSNQGILKQSSQPATLSSELPQVQSVASVTERQLQVAQQPPTQCKQTLIDSEVTDSVVSLAAIANVIL